MWDKRNPKGDARGISYQHEYIVCLPGALENQVREEVKGVIFKLLLNKEEKEEALINAMCSKVCDLEDTIRIEYM